jgi:murein DD-endopeptidase MepM/ murein hydrolase activator NlpD
LQLQFSMGPADFSVNGVTSSLNLLESSLAGSPQPLEITKLKRASLLLMFACLPIGRAHAKQPVHAPVKKSCDSGVVLKLSSATASQGGLLLAEISAANPAQEFSADWDGRSIPLWRETPASRTLHALVGVDLEKPVGRYEWRISWSGADGKPLVCSLPVTVRAGKFLTERLTVEKQFVQPDPEQQKRVEEDQKKMKAIYDTVTPEVLWKGKFVLPLKGVSTGGNFGRRRILNGEARSPHAGVDFPAAAGTPVYAAQSGKVVLAENLYYSGNTVVIDHGYGIYTLYAHLSEIGVRAGDPVEATAEIGKVGATGRVTGPHLHWGLTIDHARVNALQIVQRQP